MKLIPYTDIRNAIPAIALVAANVTVMAGPKVQLVAILAVFALFFRYLEIDRKGVVLIGYVCLILGIGFLTYGGHHAVVKAGKLALFCLASALAVRGSGDGDKSFPALVALRAFFGLCAANFLYAAATGNKVFRADHFIEFSIYSSYTIGLLVYLARPRLTLSDRGLAWVFALLCGSTTGLVVLILADLIGRKWKPKFVIGSACVAPFAVFALHRLMEARGKELSLEFLANSDRAVLLRTFYDTTLQTFSKTDWLFGVGVGRPFHEFITPDRGFDGYLYRLGEDGIYSFCLHNEAARILCDFGLVGLLLVGLRLFANCRLPVLVLLGLCMLTNSYLYSFSGALIASSLFNPKPARLRSRAREQREIETPETDRAYA
ncbi:MAG: hypothetical protein HKN23_17840 [Verrucomicrobiales bacterium]|nr:hypothetical protein [Verrucomicrobiales bacterium]